MVLLVHIVLSGVLLIDEIRVIRILMIERVIDNLFLGRQERVQCLLVLQLLIHPLIILKLKNLNQLVILLIFGALKVFFYIFELLLLLDEIILYVFLAII